MAGAAGLAVVVAHDWPLFLGFKGGRGISPYLGSLLLLFPAGVVWLLVTLGIGKLLRQTAGLSLLGIATLPLGAWLLGRPAAVVLAAVGMLLLTLLKRVEANRRPLPRDPAERRRVVVRRLILDRDVPAGAAWVERRPDGEVS